MHGIIHVEFRDYAVGQIGEDGWSELLREARVDHATYRITETYPDDELTGLVLALARRTDRRVDAVLEDAGRSAARGLLTTYGSFVRPGWRTLDVVEQTETVIHRAVRMRDPGAEPPALEAQRRSPGEVVVLYRSARGLCALGRGIILGIADHHGEAVTVSETRCQHLGDPECEIVVRVQAAAA